MKWVGRVLLIVLIASTLFVAKQNDFSPVAVAQTSQFEIQSCEDILLELNRVAPSNIVEIIRCQRETNYFGDTWNALVEFSPYVSTPSGPWPYPPELWQDNACAPNRDNAGYDYEDCFTDTPNRFNKIGQIKNFLTFGCPTLVGGGLPVLGEWECHTRQESLGNDSYRMFVQTHLVFTVPVLPDLVVDLSQAKARVDGSIRDKAFVSTDTTEFKITGIRVSNIGDATAPAGFALDVGLDDYFIKTTLPEIAPNQSIEVGEVNLLDHWRALQELGAVKAILMSGTNTPDLRVEVNPDPKPLTEKRFDNNYATSAEFFSFPAARFDVEIANSHTPAGEAVVSISLNGKRQDELTDYGVGAYFAPLAKPGASTNYTVTVSFEGEPDIGRGSIEVRDYVIYDQTIVIDPKDGLVIDPYLLEPDEYNSKPSDFVGFVAKGAVTGNVTVAVVGAGDKLLTQDLIGGKAKFSELKSGEKVLVKSIRAVAVFDLYYELRNQRVTYRWSETANGPLEIEYQGDRQVEEVEIKLVTNCETKTANGKIKICIYDDEENQAAAQKTWLPVAVKTLDRMTNFYPSTALTVTQEVWAMAKVSGGGHFDPDNPEYLFFSSRIAATDNLIATDIVMHEAMHAIDFQNGVSGLFSEQDESFIKSMLLTSEGSAPTLSSATGIWTWENVGWFCGVAPTRLKDICIGHDDPRDGPAEVWADQMTTLCLLPAELKGKIANFEDVYRTNPMKDAEGNALPPPADLAEHVSILASRSVGDDVFAPGRGYVIWGANGSNTMVLNVLRMANSCDPSVGEAKTP